MNFIERIVIKTEVKKMFTALRTSVAGYKTYAVAGLAVLLPIVGFLWGPIDVPVGVTIVHIPQFDFVTVFHAIQVSALATTLRAAIARLLKKDAVQAAPQKV